MQDSRQRVQAMIKNSGSKSLPSLATIPILVLCVVLQRQFIRGGMLSGLQG